MYTVVTCPWPTAAGTFTFVRGEAHTHTHTLSLSQGWSSFPYLVQRVEYKRVSPYHDGPEQWPRAEGVVDLEKKGAGGEEENLHCAQQVGKVAKVDHEVPLRQAGRQAGRQADRQSRLA